MNPIDTRTWVGFTRSFAKAFGFSFGSKGSWAAGPETGAATAVGLLRFAIISQVFHHSVVFWCRTASRHTLSPAMFSFFAGLCCFAGVRQVSGVSAGFRLLGTGGWWGTAARLQGCTVGGSILRSSWVTRHTSELDICYVYSMRGAVVPATLRGART